MFKMSLISPVNGTLQTSVPKCIFFENFQKQCCFLSISRQDDSVNLWQLLRCWVRLNRYAYETQEPENVQNFDMPDASESGSGTYNALMKTTPSASTTITTQSKLNDDAWLQFVTMKILLPIVLVLIAICVVLGVVLIVKSYMMAPLKQNLATAIRRRRRFGHAPDNNYIPQEEIRASQRLGTVCLSDRKSLPPPEVLMAARERASQMFTV